MYFCVCSVLGVCGAEVHCNVSISLFINLFTAMTSLDQSKYTGNSLQQCPTGTVSPKDSCVSLHKQLPEGRACANVLLASHA